jgi:uncharacterized protein
MVAQLLKTGANANAEDFEGHRAIARAAMWGHDQVAKLLLEAGAEVDTQGFRGRTALHEASRHNRQGIIAPLLKAGSHINAKDSKARTALSWAAATLGYTAVVEQLLQAGSEVNARNNQGETILAHLADYTDRSTEILKRAIEARIYSDKSEEQTRRYLAAKEGCAEVEKLLLDAGANI